MGSVPDMWVGIACRNRAVPDRAGGRQAEEGAGRSGGKARQAASRHPHLGLCSDMTKSLTSWKPLRRSPRPVGGRAGVRC